MMNTMLKNLKRLPLSTILAAKRYGMDNIIPQTANPGSKLCMAVLRGDNFEVREYIAQGTNINYRDIPDGWTPLIYSIYYGNDTAREILLDHNADINLADFAGRTPVMFAAIRGKKDLVTKLISMGADCSRNDYIGKTALDFAIEYKQQKCIDILFDQQFKEIMQ